MTYPEELVTLSKAAAERGAKLYLVGGGVRNGLLGLPASDLDITGRLLQDEVLGLCDELGIPCVKMSTALGTLHIRVGTEIAEYTPFRTEDYAPGGAHRPETVRFGVSMEEDAVRRDFTVNALYKDILTGEITDPLGGLEDLKKRRLRMCAPDTLSSDALRILRLVRFSAELGFSVEPETLEKARENAPLLRDIVPERKKEELMRILLADAKYAGGTVEITPAYLPDPPEFAENVFDALMLMDDIGVWAELIPELNEGRGEDQNCIFHKYTVQEHIFRAAAFAPRDPLLRLTMLLHDVGKPACKKRDGNYHEHDLIGTDMARTILERLRFSNREREIVPELIHAHMFDTGKNAKKNTVRKHFLALGRENTARLIAVREADVHGCGTDDGFIAEKWRSIFGEMLTDGTPFSENELKITGRELMELTGVKEGRAVGEIKKELLRLCLADPAKNERERLLAAARHTEAYHALKRLEKAADLTDL